MAVSLHPRPTPTKAEVGDSRLVKKLIISERYLGILFVGKYVTGDTARRYANNWSMAEMETHGFVPSNSGILKPGYGVNTP
jgi:hypothetical protein